MFAKLWHKFLLDIWIVQKLLYIVRMAYGQCITFSKKLKCSEIYVILQTWPRHFMIMSCRVYTSSSVGINPWYSISKRKLILYSDKIHVSYLYDQPVSMLEKFFGTVAILTMWHFNIDGLNMNALQLEFHTKKIIQTSVRFEFMIIVPTRYEPRTTSYRCWMKNMRF